MTKSPRRSVRLYAVLLRLYPTSLRKQFGEDMLEVFEQQLRDAADLSGWRGEFDTWSCVASETIRTLAVSYMQAIGVSVISVLTSFLVMRALLSRLSH